MIGIDFGCIIQRNDGKDMTADQSGEVTKAILATIEKMDMSAAGGGLPVRIFK